MTSNESFVELLTDRGPAAIAVIRLLGPLVPAFAARYLRSSGSAKGVAARRAPVGGDISALHGNAAPSEQLQWPSGDVNKRTLLGDGRETVHNSAGDAATIASLHPTGALQIPDVDERGEALDEVVVSLHGDADNPEIRVHTHGGRGIVESVLGLARRMGFHDAGEGHACSLWRDDDGLKSRAFALLPRMKTLAGASWLLHQADAFPAKLRELQARFAAGDRDAVRAELQSLAARYAILEWFTTPARIALIGPPNAGKSTLLNALTDRSSAISSPMAGTTRDWVEAPGEVSGFPVIWIDTAGVRHDADSELEREGIRRSLAVASEADFVIAVLDGSPAGEAATRSFVELTAVSMPGLVLLNKEDLGQPSTAFRSLVASRWGCPALPISAATRDGLVAVGQAVLAGFGRNHVDLSSPAPFVAGDLAPFVFPNWL